ncbi:MAG: hypothetical protein HONBIEJF_01958 [Fimbriimonadaceae bacterium]|nr:hypothetical protein [Fimbriimonadaceae bacterium]
MLRVLLLIAICLTYWCCGGQSSVQYGVVGHNRIGSEFFGLHIHHAANRTPFPSAKFGAFRTHDAGGTTWSAMERYEGAWDFESMDRIVTMMRARGVPILHTLGQTPRWAARHPETPSPYGWPMEGAPSPPSDLKTWKRYVEVVAKRYKGQIEAYEIWNEPNSPNFWVGTPEEMAEMTRIAAEVIRSVDPQAILVSPPCSSAEGLEWFGRFLAAGGGRHVDVIGYHMYLRDEDLPEATSTFAAYLRYLLARHGLEVKPLWDTESFIGKAGKHEYQGELAAGLLARAFLVHAAEGIERFYWYAWDNVEYPGIRLVSDAIDVPSEAGDAMAKLQDWLVGRKIISVDRTGGRWTITLTTPSGAIERILWCKGVDQFMSVPAPSTWGASECQTITGKKIPVKDGRLEIGPIPVRIL